MVEWFWSETSHSPCHDSWVRSTRCLSDTSSFPRHSVWDTAPGLVGFEHILLLHKVAPQLLHF